MYKKLLYFVGTSVAIGVAYLKGLSHGQKLTSSVDELREVAEEVDAENIETLEEETGEHVGRVVDATEEEVSDSEDEGESVECKDEDCDRTFDNEHGMNIHYGIEHSSDEE